MVALTLTRLLGQNTARFFEISIACDLSMPRTNNYPGEFYFDLNCDGSIEGEFTHGGVRGFGSERGIRVDQSPIGSIEGEFDVVWIEPDSKDVEHSRLKILREEAREEGRYELLWFDPDSNNRLLFTGYAFLRDDRLFGWFVSNQ